MKLLFITIIVLVIPLFFLLVIVMSTVSKLTKLRNRCRELRERVQAAPLAESEGPSDFNLAAEQYNAARTKLPAKLLAACCGFHEMESLPNHPVDGRREGVR